MASKSQVHSLHVHRSQSHFKWNHALPPVLTVDSGAEVSFDLLDGGHNQITDKSTIDDVINFDPNFADPAFGPIYVTGSEPGDVLKIEFLDLQCAEYGWTAIMKGFGLLEDEFPEAQLKIWDLGSAQLQKGYAVFKEGIHVPIRPFLGVVGVAPGEVGEFSTIPPWDWGGNIDCKYITKGSTLYLPVQVPGALFSCGDGHAAQGDGEVGGTAIETPMRARVRLTVEKGKQWITSPQYVTNVLSLAQAEVLGKGEYGCLGIDADLREAARQACRQMIEWLGHEKGLSRPEACMLMSVVGDLKIVEAVDIPHYAVSMSLPLSIFVGEK
jgi:acetamidase/formamidase